MKNINRKLINISAINDGDLTGEVGLQAEGGLMEFRKVELTPIMENQN